MVTCLPSCKPSKQDMLGTAEEVRKPLGHTSFGQTAKTYIHELCANTGSRLVGIPKVITDRDGWQERVKRIHTVSTH